MNTADKPKGGTPAAISGGERSSNPARSEAAPVPQAQTRLDARGGEPAEAETSADWMPERPWWLTKEPVKSALERRYERAKLVPVSLVAKEWGVTSRRIRVLLTEKRLDGWKSANGQWFVRRPYSFTDGARGPRLKRDRMPEKPRLTVVRIAE